MKIQVIVVAALCALAAPCALAQQAEQRPQTPLPPFDYHVEEVVFVNAEAGVRLAGTLTIPRGDGPFPAAVLISGAGPHDRDETHDEGHKPFAVLADHLTRNGVAVLRYDDRGTAGSTGDFASATWLDLAADAQAAASYLRTRAEIAGGEVGLIGHSQGGIIAPITAAADPEIAFLVSLAGPSTDFIDLTLDQRRRAALAQGAPEEAIAPGLARLRLMMETVAAADDAVDAQSRLRALLEEQDVPEAAREAAIGELTASPMMIALHNQPQVTLPRVEAPVLALAGTLDTVLDADANLAAIAAALPDGADVTTIKLDGLNHWFQTSETGAPEEVAAIDETFAPAALEAVSDWIAARFGR
jgi:hypothetical protein